MSTSVLQPLNSRAVYSHHASFLYVAFVLRSPKTAPHRRGLVLASGFFEVFFPEFFQCATSCILVPR